jgi:hypothetical protein
LTLAPLAPVVVLLAFEAQVTRWLEHLFGRQERNLAAPQHIDTNLDALPELGLDALVAEAGRVYAIARRLAASVLAREPVGDLRKGRDRDALRDLAESLEQGVTAVARRALSPRAAEALPCLARSARSSWELGEQSAWLCDEGLSQEGPLGAMLEARILRLQLDLARLIEVTEPLDAKYCPEGFERHLGALERRLGEIREGAVRRCADGDVAPADLERSVERLATLQRLSRLAVDTASDIHRARGEALVFAAEPETEASEAPAVA